MTRKNLPFDVMKFIDTIKETVGPDEAHTAEEICTWGVTNGFTVTINDYGKIEGRLPRNGELMKRFGISAREGSSNYYVYFHTEKLDSLSPFNQQLNRDALFERLEKIHPAMIIHPAARNGNGSPSILLSYLNDRPTLTKWFETLKWFAEEINKAN